MLTTTGSVIVIVAGALAGLGVGFAVASLASVPFAQVGGAAIGAVAAYALTLLLK